MNCQNCKSEVNEKDEFCGSCGSKLDGLGAVPAKTSRLIGIIASGFGLAVIMFALFNYQSTGEALRMDNNPGIGLQHVMSVPIGIVGLIVLIAGLFSMRGSSQKQ
jgi:hypothetical protein